FSSSLHEADHRRRLDVSAHVLGHPQTRNASSTLDVLDEVTPRAVVVRPCDAAPRVFVHLRALFCSCTASHTLSPVVPWPASQRRATAVPPEPPRRRRVAGVHPLTTLVNTTTTSLSRPVLRRVGAIVKQPTVETSEGLTAVSAEG